MHTTTRRPTAGYTLVEVMIAVAVVGILAAAAMPLFTPDAATHLDSFARIVAGELSHVRELAVSNNSKYRVTFETSRNRFYLEHSGTNAALDALPPTMFPDPANTAARQYVDLDELPQLGTGVFLAAVVAGGAASSSVEFGPLGSTTSVEETLVWLTAGAGGDRQYVAVRINPVTGLTTVDPLTAAAPTSGS